MLYYSKNEKLSTQYKIRTIVVVDMVCIIIHALSSLCHIDYKFKKSTTDS